MLHMAFRACNPVAFVNVLGMAIVPLGMPASVGFGTTDWILGGNVRGSIDGTPGPRKATTFLGRSRHGQNLNLCYPAGGVVNDKFAEIVGYNPVPIPLVTTLEKDVPTHP